MPTLIQQPLPKTPHSTWWLGSVVACGVGLGLFMSSSHVIAQDTAVPWECSEYTGEAQTRCMHTLLELQQEKIAKLEEQLKTQEETVNDLKEKMDRQEALARREAQANKHDPRYPPLPYVPAYAYPYGPSYGYAQVPPIGIYLQPPWRYPRHYGYGFGYGGYGPPVLGFNFRFGGGHKHRRR
jgi:hypothetical protein